MRYVGLGRDNLRSHFVFRPRHAPEWLRARFLPVVFLANEEELTGKTFTTSLNTTNPNPYVKFIFLRTSPLIVIIVHWLVALFDQILAGDEKGMLEDMYVAARQLNHVKFEVNFFWSVTRVAELGSPAGFEVRAVIGHQNFAAAVIKL